jgi:hypothetical protein
MRMAVIALRKLTATSDAHGRHRAEKTRRYQDEHQQRDAQHAFKLFAQRHDGHSFRLARVWSALNE